MKKNVYNTFRTPEIWREVLKHNKMLIEDYRLELESRNKSKGTINQYINDLKILACWVYTELDNIPFYKMSKKDMRNFVLSLKDKGMSPARINRVLSAVRTMLDYAIDDEDYEEEYIKNVAAKIKGLVKTKVRNIEFLTSEEVDILHKRLIEMGEYQQALLLAILIDSAGRKNEVYQIKKSSIREDSIFTNEVIGKGGKDFELMYNKMTKDTFKLYIEQRGEDKEDYLWYKKQNGVISPVNSDALYNWVKGWNKILEDETGIYKDFNIHSFRHTALDLLSTGQHYLCKLLNKKNFSLDELQMIAHYNDISTTNSYIQDRSKEKLEKIFTIQGDINE